MFSPMFVCSEGEWGYPGPGDQGVPWSGSSCLRERVDLSGPGHPVRGKGVPWFR